MSHHVILDCSNPGVVKKVELTAAEEKAREARRNRPDNPNRLEAEKRKKRARVLQALEALGIDKADLEATWGKY
jgi:hypothetical protein